MPDFIQLEALGLAEGICDPDQPILGIVLVRGGSAPTGPAASFQSPKKSVAPLRSKGCPLRRHLGSGWRSLSDVRRPSRIVVVAEVPSQCEPVTCIIAVSDPVGLITTDPKSVAAQILQP